MQVRKRNGDSRAGRREQDRPRRAALRGELDEVDPLRVATKTISGLYDGATTAELDLLSIQTAAELTGEEPQYSRLAARLLAGYIDKEVRGQGIASFSQSVSLGHAEGLIGDQTATFVKDNARKLDDAIAPRGLGVRVLRPQDRLRPLSAAPPERPPGHREPPVLPAQGGLWPEQDGGGGDRLLRMISSLAYLPSSPTLFNSGTSHPQMSSCFLLDSPLDDLDSIYDRYAEVARLRKFSGGIGLAYSRVRSRGSLIRGTNGPPTASCRG